jgi:hypothetical protein
LGLAIQSTLERGFGSTTLEFKISFIRPITPETGPVKAEGTVINRGRRVGTAEGRVTDSKGRLLVHATTTSGGGGTGGGCSLPDADACSCVATASGVVVACVAGGAVSDGGGDARVVE